MMKRFIVIVLLTTTVYSQDYTLTSPVSRPAEAKHTLNTVDIDFVNNKIIVTIDVKGTGNEGIRYFNSVVPDPAHPSATYAGLLTAIGSARSGETGSPERRANFRIIGYLSDNGYFPPGTANP